MKKTRTGARRVQRPTAKPGHVSEEQVRWLLHELQVHSEEITVQNEQLIKAQVEIEHARDRYAILYDFAPVGYLSLDAHGGIHECNFAASSLLGRPRSFLLQVPLPALVVTEYRPLLRDFLQGAVRDDEEGGAIEVQVKAAPHRIVRLFAKARHSTGGAQMLFTAMMDVTVERQLENERRQALAREQARTRELATQVADRTRAENRVKALLQRLVMVQEEERRRLSRELHDELGQQLTALRLTLSLLKQQPVSDGVKEQLDAADAIAARLDHDVDHLAWALRPPAIDDFGLVPALDTFVRQWSDYHHIAADLESSSNIARLSGDAENHLYRIVQEALNNVVKHAQATHVSIRLYQSAHQLRMTIHDNGQGFDPAAAGGSAGMGLLGMRERAALIGGTINVESSKQKGSTITVRLPLPVK